MDSSSAPAHPSAPASSAAAAASASASAPVSAYDPALAAAWRAEMPLDDGILFLNPGTLGGTLRCAADLAEELRRRWNAAGAGAALDVEGADGYQRMRRMADAARRSLADWLGTAVRQVALTGNTTDGLHQALASIDWRPGDHVVTTDEEHEALDRALDRLAAARGVAVTRIAFPKADDDLAFARAAVAAVGPRTRLVALSHVSCRSGVTAPIGAIASALAPGGPLLLVDGAHSAGTRAPLIAEGVDFYAFPGHKWLFGPVGTGALWLSARALAETAPALQGAPSLSETGEELASLDGAWRYEAGTRDWAALAGLGQAVRFRRAWPEAAYVAHYTALADAWRRGVGDRWPVTGRGPVLLMAMPEAAAWPIARRLWRERRTIVKPTHEGIRITLGPWLALDEVEAAARALVAAADGSH
jgi:selenocysteine lyase/cysteine desulfurase